jgi:hypothetical protein
MHAVISFETQEATPQALQEVRSELNECGLWGIRSNRTGDLVKLHNSILYGDFDASSTLELRDRLFRLVSIVLANHKIPGKIFVIVGHDLTWTFGNEYFNTQPSTISPGAGPKNGNVRSAG